MGVYTQLADVNGPKAGFPKGYLYRYSSASDVRDENVELGFV